jgi:hypothetical protein
MATEAQPLSTFRPGRAWATLSAGAALGIFAVVHTLWTGFHAPLAAWIAPLSVGLVSAGLWSLVNRRALPRWATMTLGVVAIALALLVLANVIYALTRQPQTAVGPSAVAAGTGSADQGTQAVAPTEAPCAPDALAVRVDGDTDRVDVIVRNLSDASCVLMGTPPVTIRLGQVAEAGGADGPVALPARGRYVVSFVRVDGQSACPTPIPSGTHRPGYWSVAVAGSSYLPQGTGELIVNAVNCFVYTREPGVITS